MNAEEKTMTERKAEPENRPRRLWDGALKMVKGDNTARLVEDFTAEMTLVAEGLCEDQSQLHRDVDRMINEEDRRIQKVESQMEALETEFREEREAQSREIGELKKKLSALEKQLKEQSQEAKKERENPKKKGNIIRDLTLLVSIAAGAWIIVTILNLIKG